MIAVVILLMAMNGIATLSFSAGRQGRILVARRALKATTTAIALIVTATWGSPLALSVVNDPPGATASGAAKAHGLAPLRITGTVKRAAESLVNIETSLSRIQVTPKHPFAILGRGWTAAGDLVVGDVIQTAVEGDPATIVSVLATQVPRIPVYNMTVQASHAYFVGGDKLMVHNGCGASRPRSHGSSPRERSYSFGDLVSAIGPPSSVATNRARERPYHRPRQVQDLRPGGPTPHLDPSQGTYLWVVGPDGTFTIAPEEQYGFISNGGPRAVKHGDLNPGEDGASRGEARAGGELIPEYRNGSFTGQWIMNNNSAYVFDRTDGYESSVESLKAARALFEHDGGNGQNIDLRDFHGNRVF